jgi:hypothetical protein
MVRFALLVLTGASLYAQAVFPSFGAESLAGKKVSMPAAVQGHPALLIVCFTHASGPHCTEWSKRLTSDFKGNAALEQYTLVFLEDAPRLVRGMAKSGIKSGVPKEDYDRFLIVTEHEKEVKSAVHFDAPDDAYLVLLGPDGSVRWTAHNAAVTDDVVSKIRELVR